MIRSLDIRPGERPLNGQRLAIHMAHATAPDATLVRSARPRLSRVRYPSLWALLAAPAFALSLIAAWAILHWGLR